MYVEIDWFIDLTVDRFPYLLSSSRYSSSEDFPSLKPPTLDVYSRCSSGVKSEKEREAGVMVRRWFVEGAKLIQGWERHSFRPTKMSSKSGMPGKTGVTKRPAGIRGPRDSEEAEEWKEIEGVESRMSRRKGGDAHLSQTTKPEGFATWKSVGVENRARTTGKANGRETDTGERSSR